MSFILIVYPKKLSYLQGNQCLMDTLSASLRSVRGEYIMPLQFYIKAFSWYIGINDVGQKV